MSKISFQPRLKNVRYNPGPKKDSRYSSVTAKRNISSFFTQLSAYCFGGNSFQKNKYYPIPVGDKERRYFSPDSLVRGRNESMGREVKAIYRRSQKPHCSIGQLENNCFFLLDEANKGRTSSNYQYLIWGYGDSAEVGAFHELTRGELARNLLLQDKNVLILPLNLVLPLYIVSNRHCFDHTSSLGPDEGSYWGPPRSQLTSLRKGDISFVEKGIEALIRKQTTGVFGKQQKTFPEDFELGKLKFERKTVGPVPTKYYGDFKIPPFEVFSYSLEKEVHQQWMLHFLENHERILGALNLSDLFQMNKDWKSKQDELPF